MALALAGPVAALAACTSGGEQSDQAPATSPAATDAMPRAAADEAALVAQYEAALERVADGQTELRAALSQIRDQHRAHLDALGGATDAPPPATLPSGTAAVLAELIDAERAASKERIDACVDTPDPDLARVLSLIAASEASHVPVLRDLRAVSTSGGTT